MVVKVSSDTERILYTSLTSEDTPLYYGGSEWLLLDSVLLCADLNEYHLTWGFINSLLERIQHDLNLRQSLVL